MTGTTGLVFSLLLLWFASVFVRGWYRPDAIRSPEVRESYAAWRSLAGTVPFLAAHAGLAFVLGVSGIAAYFWPSLLIVTAARVLLVVAVGLYLTGFSLVRFRELRTTPAGAKILRTCGTIGAIALALGAWLAFELLEWIRSIGR